MIKILEIAATMLIIMIGNKVEDYYKADLIELHLSNGVIEYVKINKENNYSCPKNCKAKHFHNTLISNENKLELNYNLIYDSKKNKISLNGVNIINVFEVIDNKNNKKNKNRINKKNQIDLQNFINRYH